MAKTIKSWNDFQCIIENRIQLALQQTQDVVAQCLHESLNEYYKEQVFNDGTSDTPSSYRRTYRSDMFSKTKPYMAKMVIPTRYDATMKVCFHL